MCLRAGVHMHTEDLADGQLPALPVAVLMQAVQAECGGNERA